MPLKRSKWIKARHTEATQRKQTAGIILAIGNLTGSHDELLLVPTPTASVHSTTNPGPTEARTLPDLCLTESSTCVPSGF